MIDHIDAKGTLLHSSDWLNYIVVMVISLWAGFVSYFTKKVGDFNWLTFLVHLSSAGFAGTMAHFLCMHMGVTGPLVGAISGIAAYTGTPALVKMLMKLKDVQRVLMGGQT